MKFKMYFKWGINAPRQHVIWEDGRITGDSVTVFMLEDIINRFKNKPINITGLGPIRKGDPIKDPLLFVAVAQQNLRGVRVEGDIPVIPNFKGII